MTGKRSGKLTGGNEKEDWEIFNILCASDDDIGKVSAKNKKSGCKNQNSIHLGQTEKKVVNGKRFVKLVPGL